MQTGSGDLTTFYICWRFLISCLTQAAPLLRKQESDGHFPRDNTAGTAWLPPGSPAPAAGLPLSLDEVSQLWPACMPVDESIMYDEKGWLHVCCGLRCSLFSVTQRFYYFIVYKLLKLAKYLHSHPKEDWWRVIQDRHPVSKNLLYYKSTRAPGHISEDKWRADGLGYLQILCASLISPHTFSRRLQNRFQSNLRLVATDFRSIWRSTASWQKYLVDKWGTTHSSQTGLHWGSEQIHKCLPKIHSGVKQLFWTTLAGLGHQI